MLQRSAGDMKEDEMETTIQMGDDAVDDSSESLKKLHRSSFDVLGICCPSEVPLVERILKPLAGVESVSVNVASKTVTVLHDPLLITSLQIVKALNQARLEASVRVRGELKSSKKWPTPYTILSGLLLLISLFKFWFDPLKWVALGAVAAGLPPIVFRGFLALKGRILDIHVLMLIAVAGSIWLGDYLEAASIVFLFTLAEWLESRSTDKARAAIGSVMNLAPLTAVLAGSNLKVPVENVALDTLLSVKAGDVIPIDGVVVSGRSTVDESTLTGESVPVEKDAGSPVWAGTHNLTGYLCVKTTALASESTVARMVKLVEEAQNQRSRTDQIIQRFAKFYTPAVVLVAAAVAAEGFINRRARRRWFYLALELLVIACPCALVVSTPVATTCGLAQAAKRGLLIKGSNFLETLGRLKAVAFDKTGTLTEGDFKVTYARHLDSSVDALTVLHWMLSLESKSSHPMSSAIVAYAKEKGVNSAAAEVEDFQTLTGEGISGIIAGKRIYVGNSRLASRLGWHIPEKASVETGGTSVGYVGTEDRVLFVFHVADTLRPEAPEALESLAKLGVQLGMLTGDSATVAATVQSQLAERAELLSVHAELFPEDKVKLVKEMKREWGRIAMVGDGINDAPALAAADLGIAMGVAGSNVAMETSDVALMSNDLRKIADAVKLGKECLRTIYVNIVMSFVTKGLILGLAFAGYASLWIAVVADVGTCLLVTFNSMLLLRHDRSHRSPRRHHHHHHKHNTIKNKNKNSDDKHEHEHEHGAGHEKDVKGHAAAPCGLEEGIGSNAPHSRCACDCE